MDSGGMVLAMHLNATLCKQQVADLQFGNFRTFYAYYENHSVRIKTE